MTKPLVPASVILALATGGFVWEAFEAEPNDTTLRIFAVLMILNLHLWLKERSHKNYLKEKKE